jgi:hypothetical protein
MKYLIVKASPGFGDRMQSLIGAVRFALDHKLIIYVDWTDSVWSHSGETFYTYFNLVNMPTIKSLDEIPCECSIFPTQWTGKLKNKLTSEFYKEHSGKLDIAFNKVYNEDVIVYISNGWRKIFRDISFFMNVFRVVDPRILTEVRNRKKTYELSKKVGIHLRGTDRFPTVESKQRKMKELNLQLLQYGLLNGLNCVTVTDDVEFTALWKARYPNFIILTNNKSISKKAVHLMSKDELQITKDEANVNLLIDLFTLSHCKRIISTHSDSRFTAIAKQFSPYISQLFN